MIWNRAAPTEPGCYWAVHPSNDTARFVELAPGYTARENVSEEQLEAFIVGLEDPIRPEEFVFWSPRIEPPPWIVVPARPTSQPSPCSTEPEGSESDPEC